MAMKLTKRSNPQDPSPPYQLRTVGEMLTVRPTFVSVDTVTPRENLWFVSPGTEKPPYPSDQRFVVESA